MTVRHGGGQRLGAVATRTEVAGSMLDLCGYTGSADLSGIRLLDPCAGGGVFIMEAVERLFRSASRLGFDFLRAVRSNLVAVEIDAAGAEELRARMSARIAELHPRGETVTDPPVVSGDFLVSDIGRFDVIVGNPPYVRHERIPGGRRAAYRDLFATFRHRSDLYVAFFEKALDSLSSAGRLCFICPDRWLTNRYGGGLRDRMSAENGVPVIVGLNEARVFEDDVCGYPMIILANTDASLGHIEYFDLHDVSQLQAVAAGGGPDRRVAGLTVAKPGPGEPWIMDRRGAVPDSEGLSKIEDQGFRIGIGVATGSDSVFTGRHLMGAVEPDRLLPMVVSGDVRGGSIVWSGNYVLNPFDDDGRAIRLEDYPMTEAYLLANREVLSGRYVARKNPSGWYRTIDVIRPGLVGMPKLLLPDLSRNRAISMDVGRYYPHHNLYYITGNSIGHLKVLGAVLMSGFASRQISAVSVKMRGGMPRWQAQNLRRIMIPSIPDMPGGVRRRLAGLFDAKDAAQIDAVLDGLTAGSGRV